MLRFNVLAGAIQNHRNQALYHVYALLRILQFMAALAVCGLYAPDITASTAIGATPASLAPPPTDYVMKDAGLASTNTTHSPVIGTPEYNHELFGLVAGSFAAISTSFLWLPCLASHWFMPWDWLLFVMFTVLFGMEADIWIPKPEPGLGADINSQAVRLHHACWVDGASMGCWLLTAIYTTIKFDRWRRARKAAQAGKAWDAEVPAPAPPPPPPAGEAAE